MLPQLKSQFKSWFRSLSGRNRVETDLASEIEFHIAARRDDLIRRGVPQAEAQRRARLEFGGVEGYKEDCRQSLGLRLLDEFRSDLRYAWRQLLKAPMFSLLAIAILAIAIGANSTIFSAVDAVMMRMLPVQQPEQLRRLEWTTPKQGEVHTSYDGSMRPGGRGFIAWSFSYPVYEYLRDHTQTFAGLAGFTSGSSQFNVSVAGQAVLGKGQAVSGNYFEVIGTSAILGRTILPEDDKPGMTPVAVVTHGFWERAMGGNASVLGQTMNVNARPTTIVGVLPKGFCGVDPIWCADIYVPVQVQEAGETKPGEANPLSRPDRWHFESVGRLKPGVTDEQARTEMSSLLNQAILTYMPAGKFTPPSMNLPPAGQGLDELRRGMNMPLRVLGWTVAIIMIIACANLAGLLLARATARHREVGTRLALGAGRWRVVRQLVTESLLLSVIGGIAGLGLAYLAGGTLVGLFSGRSDPVGVDVAINFRVVAFSFLLCVLTGIAFGLAPALRATHGDLISALRTTGATADRARFRTGKALIALQMTLSLVLVTGAALFIRTLVNLRSLPLGFSPENLLVFQLDATLNGFKDQQLLNFYEDVAKRVQAMPGVRSASMARHGILRGGSTRSSFTVPNGERVGFTIQYVCPRFFETMGFPILNGRDVAWTDTETAPRVMLVNQALADKYFPGRNPMGATLVDNEDKSPLTVVGIAANTKPSDLKRDVEPTVFIPFRQNSQHRMTFMVRTQVDPMAMVSSLRAAIRSVDPNVPMFAIKTQEDHINDQMRNERVFASLLSGFAFIALLLACLGIYGTLSYLVERRTPEFGIRLALGANRGDVIRLTLKESLLSVAIGLAAGLVGALWAGKFVKTLLYGVEPNDVTAMAVAGTVLLAAALVASWWPSWRASRIAPMDALRHE